MEARIRNNRSKGGNLKSFKQPQNQQKQQQPKKRKRNRRRNKRQAGNLLITQNEKPKMFGGSDIKHIPKRSEQFCTVNGTVGFSSIKFSLNPGQATSFPWLAKEAAQWEKYRWKSMRFTYTPQVNEFADNNNGSIMMSVDTDANDAAPIDLQHALDMRPNSKGSLPARGWSFDVPARLLNSLTDGFYVRRGNVPGGSDIKNFDCGNVFLSTVGNINTNLCGYIMVEYSIDFFIPILESDFVAPVNYSLTEFVTEGTEAVPNAALTVLALGLTTVNGLNVTNDDGILRVPAGNYLFTFQVHGTSSSSQGTVIVAVLQKNAANVGDPTAFNVVGDTEFSVMSVTGQNYVSTNGSDLFALAVQMNSTAGGGTRNVYASLSLLSV